VPHPAIAGATARQVEKYSRAREAVAQNLPIPATAFGSGRSSYLPGKYFHAAYSTMSILQIRRRRRIFELDA